jgi:cytochrome c6
MFAFTGLAAADDSAGKAIYTSKCSICHGPDGHGNTAIGKNLKIKDFHSPEVQAMSEADLKGVVTNGKNKMPAFKGKLTDAQIDQVVDYIRHMAK